MVVFVYQGYRDTIDTFHGKFDTLEAAENHIYQDLVKEVQEFLDKMEQKKNGTYISEQTKTLKQVKDKIISDMGVEYYEKSLNDYEKRDAEITEHALKSLEYYENTDWKGEFKKVSQTPKPSIQEYPNKKMYEGYSQRYAKSQGNYPYIVFDPSFVPPSKEMNAEYTLLDGIREEFKDAEQPIRMSQEDLLDFFNSLKTNEEILVWYNSGIRSADDWTEMKVGRRSESKKYGVKKVALKGTGGGKFYLYNRKGRISLAMGDMATVLIAAKKRDIRNAESFGVEFNEWADQELMSHGKDISFKDWAEDEGMKHGDVPITDWAQHEEESHDERYGAEDNTESIKSAIMKLEKALGKMDGATYKMHDLDISAQPTTIAGFEMSRNGEKYDGGSYLIMTDGSIVNAAMGNADYGNITDNFEDMNEKIMQSFGAEKSEYGMICNCGNTSGWIVRSFTGQDQPPEGFFNTVYHIECPSCREYVITYQRNDSPKSPFKKNAETFEAETCPECKTNSDYICDSCAQCKGCCETSYGCYEIALCNDCDGSFIGKDIEGCCGSCDNCCECDRTYDAESIVKKYGMIAAGVITAFALLPEIKKRF